ncbi:uncharacterized protein SCHCODRAFT_02559546 [Schizophyllum commune H4-8]|nr:uncharacterized protein SCHCODRAFT_02559546 [Schizophyllum commune H4-8]KAI5900712.1 hypothetical protein SCHCODRAFT_02559546 [Schizophyllum commune H4-8]
MASDNKGGIIGPIPALMRSIVGKRIVSRLSLSVSPFPPPLAYIFINMVKHAFYKCPFSGETEELSRVQLIPDLTDDADETEVACIEWIWGLKRGGLQYYLATAHNSLYLRRDIAHLYATFQFILVPTFKDHCNIMNFMSRAHVLDRDDRDKSRRRPLTAMRPSKGLYRYVFIPFTDAARKLQAEFNLQPQAEEDLAGWIDPVLDQPLLKGSDAFPIVECYPHPYSVCSLAGDAFQYHNFGTPVTAQYSISVMHITAQWDLIKKTAHIPQWFIDSPGMEEDDITVSSREGDGYTVTSQSKNANDGVKVVYDDEEELQARVSDWANVVDPDSIPEEQPPILPEPIEVRRSERLRRRYNPYGKPEPVYRPDPIREAPWPTPEDADPYRINPSLRALWCRRHDAFDTVRMTPLLAYATTRVDVDPTAAFQASMTDTQSLEQHLAALQLFRSLFQEATDQTHRLLALVMPPYRRVQSQYYAQQTPHGGEVQIRGDYNRCRRLALLFLRPLHNTTIASADAISSQVVLSVSVPNMRKHPWKKCPFSGMTDDLWLVKPIPDLADDADEMQVACTEWVWGLKRGGLPYFLVEAHNSLYARHDIADLYSSYQFVLAPTFELVKEIMDFVEHARVLRRDEKDRSPRRPLTALKPPSGLYRYVFIPFTDDASALQQEFALQPQTTDDLTGWVNTLLGPGFEEGCEAFDYMGVRTLEMAQYATAASAVLEQWKLSTTPARVPQWFIDCPGMEDDDITITSSRAHGYTITSRGNNDEDRVKIIYEGDDVLRARVSEWAHGVDPESSPEEHQPPILSEPTEVRRSERIRRRYNPSGKLGPSTCMPDPVREAPWPTPEDADPFKFPPGWTRRSCRFPTRTFSSNDWAFFCYDSISVLSMSKHPWQKCPFSGITEDLYRVKPIPELADDADEMQVACTEWVWGLKRGQLPYHIATAHNSLYLRKDIADLVASYQVILAPTFRMVKEIMDFLDHSRILRRDEHDKSPRRPLTALKPSSGLYRYVFIPFTDAARELQTEFSLQPQTADDLSGWVNPIVGPGFMRGCDAFPIVECYAHPYYVCTFAEQALEHRRLGTMVTAQYATAASQVVELWKMTTTRARIPQWFIDSPSMEDDDITIASSQASGYTITSRGNGQDDRDEVFSEGDDVLHARVYEWAQAVDPELIPEEQLPIPSVAIEVRRSERIRRRYNPYGKPEPVYRQDPIREAPWPTPEGADPYKYPPMWTERSSRFPTRRFSSNDWAFFCYNIALALPEKS